MGLTSTLILEWDECLDNKLDFGCLSVNEGYLICLIVFSLLWDGSNFFNYNF